MKLKWSIDHLYFYIVCFVMLITIIVGVTGLVRAGVDLLIPVPDAQIGRPFPVYEVPTGRDGEQSKLPKDVIEREVAEQNKINQEREIKNSSNSAMQNIFRSIAQLLVAFPVYLYHWRMIPLLQDDE